MLPYVSLTEVRVGGVVVHVFSALITAAVVTAFLLAARRGRKRGIAREPIAEMCVWMLVMGAIGAHLARLLYDQDLLRAILHDPRLLVTRYFGIASFGGYFGGLAGALMYFRRRRLSTIERLQRLDLIGFALPFAWMIGRIGCALVHDHPGIRSDSWLAVAFPGGGRFDLGVIEALFLAALGCAFLLLDRLQWPAGFFFGAYFCIYGPFRFWLDRLHVDPPRYFGVTVDAWAASLATVVGIVTFIAVWRTRTHLNLGEKETWLTASTHC